MSYLEGAFCIFNRYTSFMLLGFSLVYSLMTACDRHIDERTIRHTLTPSLEESPVPLRRVLSLAPSHTEWMFALGAQQLLVGRTTHCDQPKEASKITDVGTLFPPDLEQLIALRPTDVLMISGHDVLKVQLTRLGVRVHTIQPRTLDEIWDGVAQLGELLDVKERAQEWISSGKRRLSSSMLLTKTPTPTVFIEVWAKPFTAAGRESFMGDLVNVAGGQVITQGLGEWPQISMEHLIQESPEVLLISTPSLYQQLISPTPPMIWRTVKAVQRKQVYLLEGRLTRPGPRLISEVLWLNQLLSSVHRP